MINEFNNIVYLSNSVIYILLSIILIMGFSLYRNQFRSSSQNNSNKSNSPMVHLPSSLVSHDRVVDSASSSRSAVSPQYLDANLNDLQQIADRIAPIMNHHPAQNIPPPPQLALIVNQPQPEQNYVANDGNNNGDINGNSVMTDDPHMLVIELERWQREQAYIRQQDEQNSTRRRWSPPSNSATFSSF